MRIGIDARFYGSVGKGLGRYTEKLVNNLEKVDRANDYVVFLRDENFNDYQPSSPNFQRKKAPFRWYSLAEQIYFPKLLNEHNFDLVHFPHFNVPMFYRQPFVVTIHDLIITHFPTTRATTLGPIKYALKRSGYNLVISSAVKRSKKVITVSEYTKQELIRHFNIADQDVAVTYEAADPFPGFHDISLDSVLHKYNIKQPYLLYVGNAYPHKNLELLLEVFKDLLEEFTELSLVLVGREDYFFKRLKTRSLELGLEKKVKFPGYVPDEDLPPIYQGARLYVFPSLAEGFGLPPLEAMQYGVPVASSSVSCMPEVLGQAAAYFDPKNKHAIVKVISELLRDPQKTDVLAQRGLEQVKKYSWSKMAEETLQIYRQVKNGS